MSPHDPILIDTDTTLASIDDDLKATFNAEASWVDKIAKCLVCSVRIVVAMVRDELADT